MEVYPDNRNPAVPRRKPGRLYIQERLEAAAKRFFVCHGRLAPGINKLENRMSVIW
jgi:hypothetical protein